MNNNGFLKENESMNYYFEAKNKSGIYNFVYNFINTNQEILTQANLKEFSSFLLPPSSFDDGKERSEQKYNETQNLINNIIMTKAQELNNQRGMTA